MSVVTLDHFSDPQAKLIEFARDINRSISQGWQPFGSLVLATGPDGSAYFAQVLVQYDTTPESPSPNA